MGISSAIEINDLPPYVSSWSAIGINGFVSGALNNWQTNFGDLPKNFVLVACPQVEVNAHGGLPRQVIELTNARQRMWHFTGCHKPYLVIMLSGDDAEARREKIQKLLSWSEGYKVEIDSDATKLQFIDAVEDIDEED